MLLLLYKLLNYLNANIILGMPLQYWVCLSNKKKKKNMRHVLKHLFMCQLLPTKCRKDDFFAIYWQTNLTLINDYLN